MKRIINWTMVLILMCGSGFLAACSSSSDDSPSAPVEPSEAEKNRELLATHFKNDASLLVETLDYDAINMSSQATDLLLKLMNKSRYFKDDMKKLMALLTIQNAVDKKNTHGVRVVFDEQGNYKASTASGMVFIFPATVEGYEKMLYKLAFSSDRNWDDIPEKLTVTLSCMYDGKETVLNKSVSDIKMDSNYPGILSIVLGTFSFNSNVEYFLPGTTDAASTLNIAASRINDGSLLFSFGYVQDKQNILNATTALPLSKDKAISSMAEVVENADNFTIQASIVNDIFFTGNVEKGKSFLSALNNVIANSGSKEQTLEQYNEYVKQLNATISMQIACGALGKGIPTQLTGEKNEDRFSVMPAFALDNTSEYTPLRNIVDQATLENLQEILRQTAIPVSSGSTVYADLLTFLLQILPIGTTNL